MTVDQNVSAFSCTKCKELLPLTIFNTPEFTECPSCNTGTFAVAFPALLKGMESGKSGEALLLDGDASCFYHPLKKAAVACSHCGRFLCLLCDIDFGGLHFCSSCLEAGKSKGKMKNLENHRMLYDDLAVSLAIVPLILFYFTIITAPIALFIAIRYWNAPSSVIPRTKVRLVVAVFFATLEIAGWGVLLYFLIVSLTTS